MNTQEQEITMEVEIIVNGISRRYQGEFHEMFNRDWDSRVHSQLEDAYFAD